MRERLRRIRKLVELREGETQAHVSNVRIAMVAQRDAAQREHEARAVIERGEKERHGLTAAPAGAGEYIMLEDWLETAALRHARALKELRSAHQEVARAQRGLQAARKREAQAQTLLERLQTQMRQQQLRKERQLEDELAQMVARNRGTKI